MESNVTATQADISRLTEKDKAELAQFINNEQQRTRIQSRESLSSWWRLCHTPCAQHGG